MPPSSFYQKGLLERSGSVVVPVIEGTRPVLVEVQALVSSSAYQNGRRTTNGIDVNRLQLLIAVLEKRAGLLMGDQRCLCKDNWRCQG